MAKWIPSREEKRAIREKLRELKDKEREKLRLRKEHQKEMSAPVDGLSRGDIIKLQKAIRKVWSWSHPKKLCVKRSLHADGFPRCENPKCKKKKVAKIFVDHIRAVGSWSDQYIERMFCPSTELQALCGPCHNAKTKVDNAKLKKLKDELDYFVTYRAGEDEPWEDI